VGLVVYAIASGLPILLIAFFGNFMKQVRAHAMHQHQQQVWVHQQCSTSTSICILLIAFFGNFM
jgi:hypothetical protein